MSTGAHIYSTAYAAYDTQSTATAGSSGEYGAGSPLPQIVNARDCKYLEMTKKDSEGGMERITGVNEQGTSTTTPLGI